MPRPTFHGLKTLIEHWTCPQSQAPTWSVSSFFIKKVLGEGVSTLPYPAYQTSKSNPFLRWLLFKGLPASTIGLLLLGSSWPHSLPFNPFFPLQRPRISCFQISPFLTVPIIIKMVEFESLHILTAAGLGLCLHSFKENSQTLLRTKAFSCQPLLPSVLRRHSNNMS